MERNKKGAYEKKMLFPKKVLSFSLILIAAGLLTYFLFINKAFQSKRGITPETSLNSQALITKTEEAPLTVKAILARRGDLVIKFKSPGEAVTERKIALKAEVSGLVKKLNVEEGQHVQKGDLLVLLDDREYKLKLAKQEALRLKYLSELYLEKQFREPEPEVQGSALEKINRGKEDFDRASALYNKGLISKENFDKAWRDYELVLIETGSRKEEIMASSKGLTQAEIDVKMARMELEKTRIRAPFTGIIAGIKISAQENVEKGRELFTLVDISQIRVQAKVLESEIGKIEVGQEVEMRFSAYPQKVFKGKTRAISPLINPEDKTCAVHIVVSNPEEEIKPGMHAEVEIAAEIYENRLLIPQEAILVRGGGNWLLLSKGN